MHAAFCDGRRQTAQGEDSRENESGMAMQEDIDFFISCEEEDMRTAEHRLIEEHVQRCAEAAAELDAMADEWSRAECVTFVDEARAAVTLSVPARMHFCELRAVYCKRIRADESSVGFSLDGFPICSLATVGELVEQGCAGNGVMIDVVDVSTSSDVEGSARCAAASA